MTEFPPGTGLPENRDDLPMYSARRPADVVVHYFRADPERPHKATGCCRVPRHELPRDGRTATTTDWSLVTCPRRPWDETP